MRIGLSVLWTGVVGTVSSTAAAQAVPTTEPREEVPADADLAAAPVQPVFSLMDSTGEGSHGLAEVAYVSPGIKNLSDDAMVVRTRVHAQYVGLAGFGGYATNSVFFFKPTFNNDSVENHVAIGNLELGGLYRRSLSPDVGIGTRLGVILPTGAESAAAARRREDPDPGGIATLVARPSDLMVASPDATGVRLGVSATYGDGRIATRGDLGFDLMVDQPGDLRNHYAFAHANLGIGLSLDRVAMTVELQNLNAIGYTQTVHCAAASLQAGIKHMTGYVLVSKPLDDYGRGNSYAVAMGVRVLL